MAEFNNFNRSVQLSYKDLTTGGKRTKTFGKIAWQTAATDTQKATSVEWLAQTLNALTNAEYVGSSVVEKQEVL